MGIDDGPADRQPHPHSAGFRGVESLENALDMFRINARPRIAHRHKDAICLVLLGADQQLSCPSSTVPIASTAFRIKFRRLVAIEHDPPQRKAPPPQAGI